ncbi:MAG: hypothetical protein J6A98_00005 [Clostridia bacterium]|nr:hypothetical protein [Clostridia bacterium]
MAGTLELDPENDPVIYTTDYGLDIKWHMAGLPANSNDIAIMPGGQKFETYAYFTHANVNWVIIGCSNKSTTLDNGVLNLANIAGYYQKAGYYNFSNTTSGIWQYLKDTTENSLDAELTDIYANYGGFFYNQTSNTISQKDVFPNAKATGELETNEVLCFCQTSFGGSSVFNSITNNGNQYSISTLKDNIDNIYSVYFADILPIVGQPLTTLYINGLDTTSITEEDPAYLFPLAGTSSESFYHGSYLSTGADGNMDINIRWWLRTGSTGNKAYAYNINANGGVNSVSKYGVITDGMVTNYSGVRPAFVLKI